MTEPFNANLQASIEADDSDGLSNALIECENIDILRVDNQWTLLHLAASKGSAKTAKLLLELGANSDAVQQSLLTPLHYAAQNGHVEVAKLLLEHGANPSAPAINLSPMRSAVTGGHAEIVRLLLRFGADPNERNYMSSTPLHWAAENNQIDCARLLLDANATIDTKDMNGRTPADLARYLNNFDFILFLEARSQHESLCAVININEVEGQTEDGQRIFL